MGIDKAIEKTLTHTSTNGKLKGINMHYKPQYLFCGADKFFRKGNNFHIRKYNHKTFTRDIEELMEEAGLPKEKACDWGPNKDRCFYGEKMQQISHKMETNTDADKVKNGFTK